MPTPYADLNEVLSTLVGRIRAALSDDFVAACLQGSFAIGGFDEHSDVDFVIAVRGLLTDPQVETLQGIHAEIFDLPCAWAQHLEGSYFPAETLRSMTRRREALWYLDNGAHALVQANHCNSLVVRQTVREHGIRLAGEAPARLVEPIPVAALRAEMLSTICDWGAEILATPDRWRNRFYQGFIVLNYCRMACDLESGTVGSKQRGAAWAKTHLDARWAGLVDRAWNTRPDPATSVRTPPEAAEFERTLAFVAQIIQRARAFTSG